jgi:hypothetical protein
MRVFASCSFLRNAMETGLRTGVGSVLLLFSCSVSVQAAENAGAATQLNADMLTDVNANSVRDCDVCPTKPTTAVKKEPLLSKRCDTCTDTTHMGAEDHSSDNSIDFPPYQDPAQASPESLKPF